MCMIVLAVVVPQMFVVVYTYKDRREGDRGREGRREGGKEREGEGERERERERGRSWSGGRERTGRRKMSEYNPFFFLRSVGIYCCLEMDEYGKFERKARTLPASMDNATLSTTWDQVMHVNVTVTLNYAVL